MKILLFIALLVQNILPLGVDSVVRIQKITYQVVMYPATPIFEITFVNSGTVNLTLSNSSVSKEVTLKVENGKSYKIEGPNFTSDKTNMEVTIKEKESEQVIKIMIEPGLSKKFYFDKYIAKNAKTSITDVISIDGDGGVQSSTKYSVNHSVILNASRVQNRIFDLKRYSIETTNLKETYIKEAYLTSTNTDLFDDVFCNKGTCKVPLTTNLVNNKITFKLNSNYCYSKSKDKVDRCSLIDNPISLSNVILSSKSIGLSSQQMDLVLILEHGHESKFTYQLKNMSFMKGIYGPCSTSVVCIEVKDALKNVDYQKEVIYP